MIEKELREIVDMMGLCDDYWLRLPTEDERANEVPKGCVPMYKQYVKYGL